MPTPCARGFFVCWGSHFFGIFGTSTLSRFSAGTGRCVLLVVLLCWAVWIRSGWIFFCNGAPLISPLISKIRHWQETKKPSLFCIEPNGMVYKCPRFVFHRIVGMGMCHVHLKHREFWDDMNWNASSTKTVEVRCHSRGQRTNCWWLRNFTSFTQACRDPTQNVPGKQAAKTEIEKVLACSRHVENWHFRLLCRSDTFVAVVSRNLAGLTQSSRASRRWCRFGPLICGCGQGLRNRPWSHCFETPRLPRSFTRQRV